MEKIFSYILDHLCNPKAAVDLADAIERKYDEVCMNPYMIEESRDMTLKNNGNHRISVQNYERNREVIIIRIFYCRQNYMEWL